MKTKIIAVALLLYGSDSWAETVSAIVENVYTNAILLNWSPKRSIYQTESYGGVSEGNFLSGGSTQVKVGEEYIFQKEILLVNYPTGGVAQGQKLRFDAKLIGTTNFTGKTIELWDGGIIPKTPEQWEQMKEDEAKELAAADQLVENQKIAAQKVADQKIYESQVRAVIWIQSQASNGDAGAQCSLGEHYLSGQGCDTNRQQGVYWLQKASDQGDIEASNLLTNLKK